MAQHLLDLAFSASKVFYETALSAKALVKATSPTVKAIEIVNSANAGVYVKGWFAASTGAVTLGTTDPDVIWFVPALKTRRILITGAGAVYSTGLVVAAVTTGGTPGVTAPTTPPGVKIVYS